MNAAAKHTPAIIERPPIVAVLGHVDHGKSTLLDFIRKSNVVAGEAGGITQHVAAYEVVHEHQGSKKRVTFIDTPGHAAFQAIRARGANVADIAILVVAADDGVKAQTLEALESIKAANIPYIVAINKIDKPNANLERTQATLLENHVYLEKLGGDVPWVAISAKNGTGIPELLDLVLLVAELGDYKADSSKPASGYVIEAYRDPKRGIAATLIITEGTLSSGMAILSNSSLAPVRIMEDHTGKALKEATFSTPVTLVGFDELPSAGAEFISYKNKKEAEKAREMGTHNSAKNEPASFDAGDRFALPVIVRADTTGSLEAIAHEASRLTTERAYVRVVQSGIGTITEADVKSALASSTTPALVFGFNVKADAQAIERARQHEISIETYDIIYKLAERLEELLKQHTPKQTVEETLGKAKLLKVFSSKKDGHVIGGSVADGKIQKGASVRVTRRNVVIGIGKLINLQSHKQNVERVETGSEFGAELSSNFEVAQGDMLECFVTTIK